MPASGAAAVLIEPSWPQLRGEFWTQHSRQGTKASGEGAQLRAMEPHPASVSLTTVYSHLPNYRHLTVKLPKFPRSELHRPSTARGATGGWRSVPP